MRRYVNRSASKNGNGNGKLPSDYDTRSTSDSAQNWRPDAKRLRTLVDRSPDMITVVGHDLTIIFQTAAGARLLGYAPDELEGTKFADLVDQAGLGRLRAACAEAADGIGRRAVRLRLRDKFGEWVEGETVAEYDPDECCLILTTRDVRERARAESQLRRQAEQRAVIVRLGAEALAGEELTELMRRASEEVAEILGADYAGVLEHVPARELFGSFVGIGVDPYRPTGPAVVRAGSQAGLTLACDVPVIVRDWETEQRFEERLRLYEQGFRSGITVRIQGTSGPFGVLSVQSREASRFNYDDGVFLQAIANILAAAIARSEGEARIRHQALHDAVTGLPNRTLFEDRVTRALATANRHGRRVAVLFLDLDKFKRVNDSLGHALGDVMLRAVAERLMVCLRAEDTLARFGGDEFAVLLPEVDTDGGVVSVVKRIGEALKEPLRTDDRHIIASASIGIAIGGAKRPRKDAQTLIRDADLAMYAAKQAGPGRWEFFAEHMYETAVQRLDLTSDLYNAVERQELTVHFQPIVTLQDEAIVGMEALVRWNHPDHGMLPPVAFLPLAEETGLIVPVGRFVLRRACESLCRWQESQPHNRELYVSVNLGAQELSAPDLAHAVKSVLEETGLRPASLVLEITEGVLLGTSSDVTAQMRELKSLGVRLAVDDFGTGYSSLGYLKDFPMDIVKIDKSFVDGLGDDEQDRLVKGIIELAHGLKLETVAEGIEHAEQASKLRAMHSELGQGFHFAKPLESADVEAILSPVPAHPFPSKSPRSIA